MITEQGRIFKNYCCPGAFICQIAMEEALALLKTSGNSDKSKLQAEYYSTDLASAAEGEMCFLLHIRVCNVTNASNWQVKFPRKISSQLMALGWNGLLLCNSPWFPMCQLQGGGHSVLKRNYKPLLKIPPALAEAVRKKSRGVIV